MTSTSATRAPEQETYGSPDVMKGAALGTFIPRKGAREHYRTYEINQRERLNSIKVKFDAKWLNGDEYRTDPHGVVKILREHYPLYHDWLYNTWWVTRYDDATSIFVDDANFASRTKRWHMRSEGFGRDLRDRLDYLWCYFNRSDRFAPEVARWLLHGFRHEGQADLVEQFCAPYQALTTARVLDVPEPDVPAFVDLWRRMMGGVTYDPLRVNAGQRALRELAAYLRPLMEQRRAGDGDDLVSVVAHMELEDGPATAEDLVASLLETDGETLQGALANMWYLLLSQLDQLEHVRRDPGQLLQRAYLETLRHSSPVLHARRYTRREVERFGQLIPVGATIVVSAAGANRDERVYADPDTFDVLRLDLCFREPRGQYRADGLPAAMTVGLGKPSKYAAIPEDRPRSVYALTRDLALTAARLLLEELQNPRLLDPEGTRLESALAGELYTAPQLPVRFERSATRQIV